MFPIATCGDVTLFIFSFLFVLLLSDIKVLEADMLHLPFEDECFDVVIEKGTMVNLWCIPWSYLDVRIFVWGKSVRGTLPGPIYRCLTGGLNAKMNRLTSIACVIRSVKTLNFSLLSAFLTISFPFFGSSTEFYFPWGSAYINLIYLHSSIRLVKCLSARYIFTLCLFLLEYEGCIIRGLWRSLESRTCDSEQSDGNAWSCS